MSAFALKGTYYCQQDAEQRYLCKKEIGLFVCKIWNGEQEQDNRSDAEEECRRGLCSPARGAQPPDKNTEVERYGGGNGFKEVRGANSGGHEKVDERDSDGAEDERESEEPAIPAAKSCAVDGERDVAAQQGDIGCRVEMRDDMGLGVHRK